MKSQIKLLGIIVLILCLIVATAAITISIYSQSQDYFEEINTITSFSVGIVSLAISAIALIVALITYTSIDSVNSISTMEGNVLENPNYTMAYSELVNKYRLCKTEKEFEQEIFNNITSILKLKSKTCKEYTDCIQTVIDHLLWFAYVDIKDKDCVKKIQGVINTLDLRYNKLSALSNGTQYLLQEHLKLIKRVLNYQSSRQNDDFTNDYQELNNIRGKLLINPVSQTVYYNYLGLEYRTKAINLMKQYANINGDEFLIEHMNLIKNINYTEKVHHEIIFYLQKAEEALSQACSLADHDLLWEGYIKFNLARVSLLNLLLGNGKSKQWKQYIAESIDARKSVLYIFSSQTNKTDSYLFSQFEKELYYAETLGYIYKECTKGLSDDEIARIYEIQNLSNNCNKDIYSRVNTYCKNIIDHYTVKDIEIISMK